MVTNSKFKVSVTMLDGSVREFLAIQIDYYLCEGYLCLTSELSSDSLDTHYILLSEVKCFLVGISDSELESQGFDI